MTEQHPARDELEWYATDGLAIALRGWPSDRVQRVEDHVAGCVACADVLAREAELELALGEVAGAELVPAELRAENEGLFRQTMTPLAWLGGAAAVAVLAVGIVFVVGASDRAPSHKDAPAVTAPVDAAPVELALDSAPDDPVR